MGIQTQIKIKSEETKMRTFYKKEGSFQSDLEVKEKWLMLILTQ